MASLAPCKDQKSAISALDNPKGPSIFIDFGEVQGTHLKATIPLIFDTECEPRSQAIISSWFEELKPWLLDYLYDAGHIRYDGANEDDVLKRAEHAVSLTYFVTNPKQIGPTSEAMKFVLSSNITAILLDDFMESNFASDHCGIEDASQLMKLLTAIRKGEYNCMDEVPKVYPALQEFIRAGYLIQAKGQELFPDFTSTCLYTVNPCNDSYAANVILSVELEQGQSAKDHECLPQDTFAVIREADVGTIVTVESVALASGVRLDDTIRGNLLLRRLISLYDTICANSNDIIGVKRDITNDGISALLYRTKTDPKMTLEASFMYAVNVVKEKTSEFKVLSAKLRRLENEQLNKYIEVLETVLHGLTIWSLQTKNRYQFNEVKFLNNKPSNAGPAQAEETA